MLAIVIDFENWNGEMLIGQLLDKAVLEVESIPTKLIDGKEKAIEHEDITHSEARFIPRDIDSKYGEAITYQRLLDIRTLLEAVGEADSYEGLLRKKIDSQGQELLDTELALVESFEKNLELEAAQIETDLALVEIYEGMVLNNG